MAMTQLKIEIPESIIIALNESENEFLKKMKIYSAMEYFKENKLSLGKAAELAGMKKIDFMMFLGEHNIPVINYSTEDFEKELEVLQKI
ncbi:MAG: hypothetical protein A2086_08365 [Spirochaetes bacterium GWD1_27_9]|nr:MAG: hypothetical protein A2Z98_13385 [Spirochaetes bacterium GWB1_27_13]OHD20912.1 MAG: hypothetical protein A2Y34_11805 [Spirochaetes bacterium GWC1_27_15]OHD39413.1 MAG: hypothetical protein A2086_08365 [Spirochaetes bacterium GWD1_27_9]